MNPTDYYLLQRPSLFLVLSQSSDDMNTSKEGRTSTTKGRFDGWTNAGEAGETYIESLHTHEQIRGRKI